MKRRGTAAAKLAAGLAALALMAGCAHQSAPSLYGWTGYQSQIYEYLKSDGTVDPAAQLTKLEVAQQKIEQDGKDLPPGYRATMGMLYAKAGQGDKGVESFNEEKAHFPESAIFMDFLLQHLTGKSE